MSETETTAPAPKLPSGMTITKKTVTVQTMAGPEEQMRSTVTFGTDPVRSVTVIDLDLGAQFDLAEIVGDNDNSEYRSYAFIAASVRDLDGVPVPGIVGGPQAKNHIRATLKKLGRAGYAAAIAGVNSFWSGTEVSQAEQQHKAAVGN